MDRNNKLANRKYLLWATCFLFFIIGCLPETKKKELAPYPYIKELNPIRKKIGLKEIDSSFLRYNQGISYSTKNKKNVYIATSFILKTYKEDRIARTPQFFSKSIAFDRTTGKPVSETDTYRSGKSIYGLVAETEIYESLSFRYDYEDYIYDHQNFDTPIVYKKRNWVCHYRYLDSFRATSSNDPSLLFKTHWELKTKEVSKKVADSILDSWGLERKNY